MLGKLLKYDIKRIYKFLIIFYILSVFFALLTRLLLNVEGSFVINLVGKICSGATISMMVSILINNIMRLWVKFKTTLYADESYLTHTLPVTKTTIYISKILVYVITMFTSILVITFTLFLAYYSKENIEFLKNILIPVSNVYNSSILEIIILFLVAFFAQTSCIFQTGYTGIILGHMVNSNKTAFSVLFGFIVYICSQSMTLLLAFLIAIFNKDLLNLFITNEVIDASMIKLLGILCLIIYIIIFIVNMIINIMLLRKGVNVE